MKRNLVYISIVVLGLFSCNDNDQETKKAEPTFTLEVENQPSAKAEDDAKASGVYKGTFVGSSGSFKLILEAGEIIGYLVVDHEEELFIEEFVLTTDDVKPSDLDGAITNALFTDGAGKVELYFSVEADGANPTVSLTIQGHEDVQVVVFKEVSTNLLKIFEGYDYKSYPELGVQVKGHFNLILGQDTAARVAYKTIEEVSLNNGVTGTLGYKSWANDAVYGLFVDSYQNTTISITRHYPNPENPEGLSLYEKLFDYDYLKYSDILIYGKREWLDDNDYYYADSTILIRKL